MSFSLIHDLNSLTAKAADTPDGKRKKIKRQVRKSRNKSASWTFLEFLLAFLDEVLVEEAVQDGGRYVAVGQQDARQHGQFVALRLREPL